MERIIEMKENMVTKYRIIVSFGIIFDLLTSKISIISEMRRQNIKIIVFEDI